MKPKAIVILVLVILFLIILIQNTHETVLRMLFWSISMPQVILIAVVLVGGFILGYLASLLARKKR